MKGLKIMTEMQKLDKYLTKHNIKHIYKRRWPEFDKQQKIMRVTATGAIYHTMKENAIDGGWQIVVSDENGEYLFDAICGYGSFGFNRGLIEIMGCIVPDDAHDSVEGSLTADEVIERIEKYYAGNEPDLNNCKGLD